MSFIFLKFTLPQGNVEFNGAAHFNGANVLLCLIASGDNLLNVSITNRSDPLVSFDED